MIDKSWEEIIQSAFPTFHSRTDHKSNVFSVQSCWWCNPTNARGLWPGNIRTETRLQLQCCGVELVINWIGLQCMSFVRRCCQCCGFGLMEALVGKLNHSTSIQRTPEKPETLVVIRSNQRCPWSRNWMLILVTFRWSWIICGELHSVSVLIFRYIRNQSSTSNYYMLWAFPVLWVERNGLINGYGYQNLLWRPIDKIT